MRNAYHSLITGVLVLSLLWMVTAVDFRTSAADSGLINSPQSPEAVAGAQAGAFHLWTSEEIGRTLVPRLHTVQW